MKLAAAVCVALAAGSTTACSTLAQPASDLADTGEAEQAWCRGLYVTQVAFRAGTVFFVSPWTMATATDGWGPQTLSLSVAEGFSPEVSFSTSPSISWTRDDVTRSLSNSLGFSLSTNVNLVASTTVLVPTGAYYRLEAYPEYEVIDWTMRADRCGGLLDVIVATGSVYRPVGVHFRAMRLVDSAWSALSPPSLGEIASLPPWAPGGLSAAANYAATGVAAPTDAGGGTASPAGANGAGSAAGASGAGSAGAASGGGR